MDSLPVLLAVGALRCLQPAGGVTLEVLPQTCAGGKPLAAGLALVGLVAGVDPLVVDEVPLRAEGLGTVHALEGSLPRVFPHVDLQVVLLDEALAAVLTKVRLAVFDSHVTVQFVRLELPLGHKAPATEGADEGLLSCVDPHVALQLRLGSE